MRCKHAFLTYQLLTVIFFMSQLMVHLTVVIALIVWQFYDDQKLFLEVQMSNGILIPNYSSCFIYMVPMKITLDSQQSQSGWQCFLINYDFPFLSSLMQSITMETTLDKKAKKHLLIYSSFLMPCNKSGTGIADGGCQNFINLNSQFISCIWHEFPSCGYVHDKYNMTGFSSSHPPSA